MDIELSARNLRQVEFREKLRGYNQEDVDDFLERAAAGVDSLHDRLRQAIERAMRAEQRTYDLPDDRDALRRTLALAQRTADMAVKEAQQHGSETLNEAQTEAQAVLAEAQERVRRTNEEAERDLRAELVRLGNARDELRQDIKALEHHLESERGRMRTDLANATAWMDQNLSAMAPPPPLSEVDVPAPAWSRASSEDGFNADHGGEANGGPVDSGSVEDLPPAVVGMEGTLSATGPGGAGPQERPPGASGLFDLDAEQWESTNGE